MEKNIVGVKFRDSGRVYYFESGDFTLHSGDYVIVETANGENFGEVVLEAKNFPIKEENTLSSVIRMATEDDIKQREYLDIKCDEAKEIFYQRSSDRDMDMKLIDAEYSFDGSKVVFYFTADGRVDFRDLVKDLAGYFHARIELRQIGVRDEARLYNSVGLCGRKCCCASWLKDFVPVSIKMAKEQNLSLNSTKISGVCGRLLCCLNFEESYYEELSKRMPKVGTRLKTPDGMGTVYKLKTLEESVLVKILNERDEIEIKCFTLEELDRAAKEPLVERKVEHVNEGIRTNIPRELIDSKKKESEEERERDKRERQKKQRENKAKKAKKAARKKKKKQSPKRSNKRGRYQGQNKKQKNARAKGKRKHQARKMKKHTRKANRKSQRRAP